MTLSLKRSSDEMHSGDMKSQAKADRTLSKALSWVLRHSAPQLKLKISSDGYVPLHAVLSLQTRNFHLYTENDVNRIVDSNDKQRFRLAMKSVQYDTTKTNKRCRYQFVKSGGEQVLCIRANQGHSIKEIVADQLLTPILPSELKGLTIIHGTYEDAWENIKHEGLNRMTRNHIHFAAGLPDNDGVISGMRKSCQIHIYINGRKCAEDGVTFYKSDNGVILTEGVLPCSYFSRVVDAKSQQEMFGKCDTDSKSSDQACCREGIQNDGIERPGGSSVGNELELEPGLLGLE